MKLIHTFKGEDIHLVVRIFMDHILRIANQTLKLGIGRITSSCAGLIFVENNEETSPMSVS